MNHSTGKPTKAEAARFEKLKTICCVACQLEGISQPCGPTEIHHLLSGNKRRGHQYSLALGSWHHRGIAQDGATTADMHFLYGPSLALQSKAFRERYGSDDMLLELVNGKLP